MSLLHTLDLVDLIIAVVLTAAASAAIAWSSFRKELRRRCLVPSGESQVVRTERRPVTLTATRRMSPQTYLDLAARYGKYPETLGLWMAEKMITADAGELAKLSRVTVARDPKRDEYVFRMTLIVVPAENEVTDDG